VPAAPGVGAARSGGGSTTHRATRRGPAPMPTDPAAAARTAYGHGKAGRNAPEWVMDDPDHFRAYSNGQAAADAPPAAEPVTPTDVTPAPSTPAPPPGSTPSLPSIPRNGAGVVLGVLVYAVLINYLRGGTPQVRAWFGAKFLNHTAGTGTAGPTAAPSISAGQIFDTFGRAPARPAPPAAPVNPLDPLNLLGRSR
jgi:hypothetical protein